MRIISGNYRGKKLYAFDGRKIRPTADRLREAVFNILSSLVQDAVVLDLFAGTGAFGLEAVSRGARSAVFIDNHTDAIRLVKKNIHACGVAALTRVVKWDIARNLKCLKGIRPGFDLVFLDPPYDKNLIRPALLHLHASNAVQTAAHMVIEHSFDEPLPHDLDCFSMVDQRKYGKSLVSFFRYMV
ncbi:MAG: 16S rRNA (guanine(966)-N(2))-methyltransferase RsmD [Thermodesulfobacteriota bacterium]